MLATLPRQRSPTASIHDRSATNAASSLDAMLANELDPAFKRRVPIVLRLLDPRPGERILDCGCGMGFTLRALAELYDCELVGLERDATTAKRASIEVGNGAAVVNGDALHLPFPDSSFDKVLMTEVLEHIPDERAALHEVRRVLRRGGSYTMTVPNQNYPFLWDPLNRTLETVAHTHIPSDIWWLAGIWADHQRLYTTATVRDSLETVGFVVDEIISFTHYCIPFHHFLVYGVGKNLLQRGLLPDGLAKSADRFRARENSGSILNPINAAARFLHWIDRQNDGLTDPRLSYVGIAVHARKAS
ncbi:MAG: glycosyl transferase, group 1 [Chloroflexi bacterium]|nr:glycosyl transferase, group 1 [Chloroflexota bacterium]